jgi:hypothetical protein
MKDVKGTKVQVSLLRRALNYYVIALHQAGDLIAEVTQVGFVSAKATVVVKAWDRG